MSTSFKHMTSSKPQYRILNVTEHSLVEAVELFSQKQCKRRRIKPEVAKWFRLELHEYLHDNSVDVVTISRLYDRGIAI
jgi:hypothetical protein